MNTWLDLNENVLQWKKDDLWLNNQEFVIE